MSLSVADINASKLTVRARWTLENIAWPMAESDLSEAQIAERQGLQRAHVAQLRADLSEEIDALTRGVTLPELRPADYEALKADIAERGQLVPILVDQNGALIDGRHRVRACQELGLEPDTKTVHVRTVEEAHDVGLAVNLARRHLTSRDKRRLVMATLIRDPEKSDRAVAAAIGVSKSTVGLVRLDLQERAKVVDSTIPRKGEAEDGTVKVSVRVSRATADGVRQGRTVIMAVPVSKELYDELLNACPVEVRSITRVAGDEVELVLASLEPSS